MTDTVKVTIDGVEVEAEKGALIIRVAEHHGIEVPRFCDHPLLDPAGACRQCLVEVVGQRKPMTACTLPAAEGMVVKTQLTSEIARDAQRGIMEFLLINHPLDCPVCDKGGECPLQNQAMSAGSAESRFHEQKRTYDKPLPISPQVLLDRERCVLCQRCTRFSDQISGDSFISLLERGADSQVGVAGEQSFTSYFSGNTIQICPVGALTGVQYRFRARPFDLVSTPGVCEHCAAGCTLRIDHRKGAVLRRMAGDDPAVNESWNCDKGRWAFQYSAMDDRLTTPLVRDPATGELRAASWSEAFDAAATGLDRARTAGGVGVLTGGRLTVEDAYAYAKFARIALGTNDIDFRARPVSEEESQFLGACVAGHADVTYAEIEAAPVVCLAGLEPEEECPILFLRLRKAQRAGTLRVLALSPFVTPGLAKLDTTLVRTVPGDEARVLGDSEDVRQAMTTPGAILLVGERLAEIPGALSASAALSASTGARLAWVPRRAGDRGALEAGCLAGLLPGGRLVPDAAARALVSQVWGLDVGALPTEPGRDTDAILEAAATGQLGGLVVAGVDPSDLADPGAAEAALDAAGFLVSCEIRRSAVTERADVVFPVAPAVEKAGTYVDWEGRVRPFVSALAATGTHGGPGVLSDARVVDAIADRMGTRLGCGDLGTLRGELAAVANMPLPGATQGVDIPALTMASAEPPRTSAAEAVSVSEGSALLATWPQLLDAGRMQDGEKHLARTARPVVARMSESMAARLGVAEGDPVVVGTERGEITLPAAVTDMPDHVVWVPTNSPGSAVRRTLGVTAGALVEIRSGGAK